VGIFAKEGQRLDNRIRRQECQRYKEFDASGWWNSSRCDG